MIKPMLAVPQRKGKIDNWNDWAIEEKYDGHRLIVEVKRTPMSHTHASKVTAWTRPRKHAADPSGKTMATRALPSHLVDALGLLPAGTYDGELLAGIEDGTSTDVTRTDLAHTLRFVVFDVLEQGGVELMSSPYDGRRKTLETLFRGHNMGPVFLADTCAVCCEDDVTKFVAGVWARGGEGAILKRRSARYQPGKRSPDFVKIKRGETAVLTVVGFEATRGEVMNRGAFASVLLRDEDGNETSCKTLNDEELAAFNAQAERIEGTLDHVLRTHPSLGRKLRISFPMRTRTGGYQGPVIWDRWEDE